MNCTTAIKSIPLYLYGELSGDDEERLEEHVDACPACRRELDEYKKIIAAIGSGELQPPSALLHECRQTLMGAVYREQIRRPLFSPWQHFQQAFRSLLTGSFKLQTPIAALALVALGYFSARFGAVSAKHTEPEDTFSTIRSVQPDASGGVQIGVDETQRRTISGTLNDGNIRRLLLAAMKDENNPGVRVESMEALKNHGISSDVRSALLEAVQQDPNPGVRLKALEGLKSFGADPDTRKILARVLLNDTNPGVRVQAIDLLMAHPDESMVGVLQNLVRKEDNNYVRSRCRNALQEMNASVGTF